MPQTPDLTVGDLWAQEPPLYKAKRSRHKAEQCGEQQRARSQTFPFTEKPVNTKLMSPPFVQMSLTPSTCSSTLVGSEGKPEKET